MAGQYKHTPRLYSLIHMLGKSGIEIFVIQIWIFESVFKLLVRVIYRRSPESWTF
jgi:hypothetical protein